MQLTIPQFFGHSCFVTMMDAAEEVLTATDGRE
jgi:hypothetical protein